jgi:hypothetical protein
MAHCPYYTCTRKNLYSFVKHTIPAGGCIIKLIMAIIYSFRNKLECLSLNTRLGWKRSPGTKTLAYYGNCKLRP